jgi:hypothetical protein
MKMESLQAINDFIEHWKLREPNRVAAFNALVDYLTDKSRHQFNAEVHIITSDNIVAVYILNNVINNKALPSMFVAKQDAFILNPEKSLVIIGKNNGLNYNISLYPVQ